MSKPLYTISGVITAGIILFACSKGGNSPTSTPPPVTDPCAGKNIAVSGTSTSSDACGSGSITVTASGSSGFTYSIDGSAFQASNTFNGVAAGDHSITAKDNGGCSKSASVTVPAVEAGPLFTAVKTMMASNCVSCHSGSGASGGKDFSKDCVIVTSADRIKARAVDGNPTFMPQGGQLSAADKKKITDWINAGGKYTN